MKKIIVLALLLLALGISQVSAAEFTANDCPFNANSSYQIDCGFVTVPADHANPDGATMQIAVALIHSNNPNKSPEPVLYLEGGPGGAPVQFAPYIGLVYPFLGAALQNHDVILVDQRGMGYSQPNFYCTPYRSIDEIFSVSFHQVFLDRMPACLDKFASEGIDWRVFTTEQNALDLAMVGEALGYEKVNLQGTSYGTLLGLIILRERPEIVRSAILDSVLIPSVTPFSTAAADYEASFSQLEAYCQADFACALAYPNLRETLFSTYERLLANPDTVELSGQTVTFTAGFLGERLRYMLASVDSAKLAPAFIVGIANQDYEVIADFVEMVNEIEVTDLPNQAFYMTMVCPLSYGIFEDQPTAFQAGGYSNINNTLCESWGDVLPFDRTMPETDVPVLLLSGELDPLTPPAWSAEAAQGLSNSQRIVLPYSSHGILQSACGQNMAFSFLKDPTAPVDTSCVNSIEPLRFALHTTVTRFPVQIATALLSLFALFGLGQMAFYGIRGFKRTAWWASFRRMGWMPLVSLLVLFFLIYANVNVLPHDFLRASVVQTMIPMFMALQVAAVFNPSDEPSLEIQMAAPRSVIWLLAERVFVVIVVYSLIALLGVCFSLWLGLEEASLMLFVGWFPPALFLSGMGIYVTVRSRMMALGVLLIGFLWFMFALFATMFLPGQVFPAPFHLIQPFLWPFHVHATIFDLAPQDFWLNRLSLTAAGMGFMLLSAYSLRDTEELLLGVKASKASNKKVDTLQKRELKTSFSLQGVEVKIQPIAQVLGIIRYEFLMRWRTRGIKVFILVPFVLMFIGIFFMNSTEALGLNPNPELYSESFMVYAYGKIFGALLCTILFVPVFYIFPVMVADAVPSDKRIGVEELLNASPLNFMTHLVGRVLGNILAALVALIIAIGLIALMWYFRYGAFVLEPLFDLFLGSALFCAITTAISIVLGATQASSRRAIFLVIGFLFLTEFFQMIEVVRFLFPSRSVYVITYFMGFADIADGIVKPHQFAVFSQDLLQVALSNFVSLLLIWLGLWAWRRWREA